MSDDATTMRDDAGTASAPPGPTARGARRRLLPPLVVGVLILIAWATLANGAGKADDAAQQYRYDRGDWSSWSAETMAPFASIDALAAAQGLSDATFGDPLAPEWSLASTQPCTIDVIPLQTGREAPRLEPQPMGVMSGAYASAQALADRDQVAIAAYDRLPEAIEAARGDVDAVCATASSLQFAQRGAARALQDGLALDYLQRASTEELTYSVVEGTAMLTVRCDGIVGCTGIDLAAWGVVVADAWTEEFVWGAQAYADAYAQCPAALADPCTAIADAYDVRAEAEQAIADAFRAGDVAAIDAAFQQRTLDADAAWADAQDAIADAGGESMEALLAQAWVTALEPVAACAQEATIRW